MERVRNYENSLFKQLEELNKKLDKLLKENKEQATTIRELTNELKKANETIEKLQNEIDRLKNKNNKNSSNSSKPSSTDITKPKKSGANLYNYRTKSGLSVGGQFGHVGSNLSKEKIEKLIEDKKVKVIEIEHVIKGNPKKEPIIKYKQGIKINSYIEKHIFRFSEESKEVLPKEFYTDVTYCNDVKALAIELGVYNIISYERLSDFFEVITKGEVSISKATLVNFTKEFSYKSESSLQNIENDLLNGKTIYTDETNSKCVGKNAFVRNYSNEENALYKSHDNKGHKPIIEDDILPKFLGGIMGDHDTSLYSYGTKNYECNVHLGRYLEELIQNEPDLVWPIKLKELLFKMNKTKKIAKLYKMKIMPKEKTKEYEEEFTAILKLAKEENKTIKSTFYKEKADKLRRRLEKYKKNHLYFIKDFDVAFDNNMSERDLRVFKIKLKVSGCFRSKEGAKNYTNILSIIKTSIKRGINPYDSITGIFNNEVLFAN